jgi:hypothetical protein
VGLFKGIDMTPCGKLGYKIGDLFEVVSKESLLFAYRSVIRLLEDDNSQAPRFELVSGWGKFGNTAFFSLDNIKPLNRDLSNITQPFGELDKQTKKDLLCAWVDGAEIEIQWQGAWQPLLRFATLERIDITKAIEMGCKIRVKPTISTKDITSVELISEAQQHLRDAQEALVQLQNL